MSTAAKAPRKTAAKAVGKPKREAKPKTVQPAKLVERFAFYAYATIADMDEGMGVEAPNEDAVQSYNNLKLAVEERGIGLKARFTIGDRGKQFLMQILATFISEIGKIKLTPPFTTTKAIADIAEAEIADSLIAFLHKASAASQESYREELANADFGRRDRQFLYQYLFGVLEEMNINSAFTSAIFSMVDEVFKYFAYHIGVMLWFNKATVNDGHFLAVLIAAGYDPSAAAEIRASIIDKPTKPRKPKAEAEAEAEEADVEEVEDDEGAEADEDTA